MNTKLKHVRDWPALAGEANWSVRELAVLCDVSIRTLETHFENNMGTTPKAWLCEQRLQKALRILREGFTVKETASELGFMHASQFSREFKRMTGYPPSEVCSIDASNRGMT
jgi:transcriptional regulator GlxA family with amidase domain